MCIYIYMYVYIYMYIYICMYVYIYVYIHIYICICIHCSLFASCMIHILLTYCSAYPSPSAECLCGAACGVPPLLHVGLLHGGDRRRAPVGTETHRAARTGRRVQPAGEYGLQNSLNLGLGLTPIYIYREIYYSPKVNSIKYCHLGVFRGDVKILLLHLVTFCKG